MTTDVPAEWIGKRGPVTGDPPSPMVIFCEGGVPGLVLSEGRDSPASSDLQQIKPSGEDSP
jgi:hypothetical protein